MAKGVVCFLQNLLSPLASKESVRCGQEVFRLRALSQTTAIGTLYGLLFTGLLLATLPRMEAQPYGGAGTTSSPADCSPPPSLSFPWLDDYMDENAKEEIFCAIWDGQAITVTFVIELPWYLFNDRPMRASDSNPVGYINREFASWDDLVNAGIKLNALKTAFTFFERKAKRARTRARLCGAACLVTWEAAALACLKLVNPKAILACEGLAASVLLACTLNCRSAWIGKIGDLRDDLEEKIIALTS